MDAESSQSFEWLTATAKALVWLAVGGLSLGFALRAYTVDAPLTEYFARNAIDMATRKSFLHWMTVGAALSCAAGLVYLARNGADAHFSGRLHVASRRISPLYLIGFAPILFNWELWRSDELTFLVLVCLFTACTFGAFRQLQITRPCDWESKVCGSLVLAVESLRHRAPRLFERLPLIVVVTATVAYIAHFAYYTLAFHHSARSGYDLALENNLMWNLVHGGPLFKSSPLVGPTGTHFGYHATLFAFVMAPVYAIYPEVDTLLVIQASLLGGAAVPLFFFARRHVGAVVACIVSLAYLLYPALHGANIFEFHYIPLGCFFLFAAAACIQAKRDIWGAIFIAITLSVREDVSAWVAVLGAYFLLSGRRPLAGVLISIVGLTYFGLIKFAVMPRFATGGGESFTFIFEKLIPPGAKGFGGVLTTVIGNPAYTLRTLVDPSKLVYVLQLLLPLAFVPLRFRLWKLLILPGFFFTLLSTEYSPTVSIHFQYGAHWMAFLFPATVLALSALRREPRRQVRAPLLAPVAALVLSSLAVSYQYGSILQGHTSFGGPIPYVFGMDQVGQQRRAAMDAIKKALPANAKVSCSGFVTPQLSSRADAYSMTLGIYDAEYIVFPTVPADFIGDERATVTRLLQTGTFGVVSIHPPFALAKRGAPTERNAEFLRSLR